MVLYIIILEVGGHSYTPMVGALHNVENESNDLLPPPVSPLPAVYILPDITQHLRSDCQ